MRMRGRHWRAPAALVAVAVLLAGCGAATSGFGLFKEDEDPPLPGKRISVLRAQDGLAVDTGASRGQIDLPAPQRNDGWPQPGGPESNSPGHLDLSGSLRTVWQASGGRGATRSSSWIPRRRSATGRLVAKPIVYRGRVYVLDVEGRISAFSASGGSRVWSASLAPESESPRGGYGGGLAAADGLIYAVTGFGTAVALDPASGNVIWETRIGQPIRSSPTAAGGNLYFVTTESELHALSGSDGEELWTVRGTPQSATLLSSVSPAVSGDTLVVPFSSGEMIAYSISDGKPVWLDALSGARESTASPLAALNDPSRPVINGTIVVASAHSGRTIANSLETGERLWTQSIGSTEAPAVAGDTVYIADVKNRLVALTRRSGRTRWVAELPQDSKWSGPVLAGGRLWVVSSKGLLLGVDAQSGEIATRRELETGVDIAPVVAGGRMYIYTADATLLALD